LTTDTQDLINPTARIDGVGGDKTKLVLKLSAELIEYCCMNLIVG
jgi:hypothetical protein